MIIAVVAATLATYHIKNKVPQEKAYVRLYATTHFIPQCFFSYRVFPRDACNHFLFSFSNTSFPFSSFVSRFHIFLCFGNTWEGSRVSPG